MEQTPQSPRNPKEALPLTSTFHHQLRSSWTHRYTLDLEKKAQALALAHSERHIEAEFISNGCEVAGFALRLVYICEWGWRDVT